MDHKDKNRKLREIVAQCNRLQDNVVGALDDAYQSGYQRGVKDVWLAVQRTADRYSGTDLQRICRRYTATDILEGKNGSDK